MPQFFKRTPPDVFRAGDGHLDVDVTPVRLEARAIAAASFDVIDGNVEAVAVDWNPAGGKCGEVHTGEKIKRPSEERVQHAVTCASRQGVDHQVASS